MQKEAYEFAQTLHLQLNETFDNLTSQAVREKPNIIQKGSAAAAENIPPIRSGDCALAPWGTGEGLLGSRNKGCVAKGVTLVRRAGPALPYFSLASDPQRNVNGVSC